MLGLFLILLMVILLYALHEVQPPVHDNSKYHICPDYDEDCESMTPLQWWSCCKGSPYLEPRICAMNNTGVGVSQWILTPLRENSLFSNILSPNFSDKFPISDVIRLDIATHEFTEREDKVICKHIPVKSTYK